MLVLLIMNMTPQGRKVKITTNNLQYYTNLVD
jgi:hypothetical protein